MKNQLILPMAFYVFYVWLLGFFMFRSRVNAVRNGEVSLKYFKAYVGPQPSERTILIGRHYDNQFQVPLLFIAGCLAHMIVGMGNNLTLGLAWFFVITRIFHSVVHLGSNNLQHRVAAFTAGWLTVLLLWAQLVYLVLV